MSETTFIHPAPGSEGSFLRKPTRVWLTRTIIGTVILVGISIAGWTTVEWLKSTDHEARPQEDSHPQPVAKVERAVALPTDMWTDGKGAAMKINLNRTASLFIGYYGYELDLDTKRVKCKSTQFDVGTFDLRPTPDNVVELILRLYEVPAVPYKLEPAQ